MPPQATSEKYKVIVIGDAGVGKTALTFRFCEGLYRDNQQVTVGVDIRVKPVQIDNEFITLNIWDTAGMEKNRRSMTGLYYRDVHAVILAYDTSNMKSFNNLPLWLEEIEQHLPPDVIKVLIGNKSDQAAAVNRQVVQQFADKHCIPLFETSAKLDSDSANITGVFLTIAHKLKNQQRLGVHKALSLNTSPSLNGEPNTPSGGCC